MPESFGPTSRIHAAFPTGSSPAVLEPVSKLNPLSAKGAKCNSLGHRPRQEQLKIPSAESAKCVGGNNDHHCFYRPYPISRLRASKIPGSPLLPLAPEPHSCGFPEGLLAQPFYGWVKRRRELLKGASASFLSPAFSQAANDG